MGCPDFSCALPSPPRTRNATSVFQDSTQVTSSPRGLVSSLFSSSTSPLELFSPYNSFELHCFCLSRDYILIYFALQERVYTSVSTREGWRVSQKVRSWLNYLSSWITMIKAPLASLSFFVKGRIITAFTFEQIFNAFLFVMWLWLMSLYKRDTWHF